MIHNNRLVSLVLPFLLVAAVAASVSVTISSTGGELVGNLTVTKADPGQPMDPLEAFSYAIAYQNVGEKLETGIVLRETVPNLTRGVGNFEWEAGATGSGEACHKVPAGTECFLELESLPPGKQGSAEFSVQVIGSLPKGVSLLESFIAIGNLTTGTLIIEDSDTVFSELSLPKLGFQKSASASTRRGALHEYVAEVINLGAQTAREVVVFETVPEYTSAGVNPGWQLSPLDGGGFPCEGSGPGSVCLFPLGDLPGGAARTVPFAVVVDRAIPDGVLEIESRATAEASDIEGVSVEVRTPLAGSLAVVDVPALSSFGLALLAVIMSFAAVDQLRRRARRPTGRSFEGNHDA